MHYGILGMKWGVRKDRKSSGKRKKAKRTKVDTRSADYKKTSKNRRRKASDLSDEELKKTIERMRLEQQYNELTAKDVSAGRKFATKTIERLANMTIDRVYQTYVLNPAIDAYTPKYVKKKK